MAQSIASSSNQYIHDRIKRGLEALNRDEQSKFLQGVDKTLQATEFRTDPLKRDLYVVGELESLLESKNVKRHQPNDYQQNYPPQYQYQTHKQQAAHQYQHRQQNYPPPHQNRNIQKSASDIVHPGGSWVSTSTLNEDDSTHKEDSEGGSAGTTKEIGPYKVLKTLGEGTFGKVRLCEHKLTKQKVAIKAIQKADVKTTKQRNSVQREVRLMKLLYHPHIIYVHDVEETEEQISIIMEYASGGELFDYIVAKGMLSEKESRIFFRQIISAVDYCHQNSIIHRDLKPENMLLDANNNIKIIDFGFGNTYHVDRQLDTYCGSPFYAAPEMIRGKPYCGPEVDLWSMGVILYALLAGRLPFEAPVISDLYQEIGRGEYQVPKHFSKPAMHLISRMLTVDPRKRATMEEIRNHPWVLDGYDLPPVSYVPPRSQFVIYPSPESISELVEFGIAEIEIRRVLSENPDQHPISSLYHMVDEARRRRKSQADHAAGLSTYDPLARFGSSQEDKSSILQNQESMRSRTTMYSPSPYTSTPLKNENVENIVSHHSLRSSLSDDEPPARRAGVYQSTPHERYNKNNNSSDINVKVPSSTTTSVTSPPESLANPATYQYGNAPVTMPYHHHQNTTLWPPVYPHHSIVQQQQGCTTEAELHSSQQQSFYNIQQLGHHHHHHIIQGGGGSTTSAAGYNQQRFNHHPDSNSMVDTNHTRTSYHQQFTSSNPNNNNDNNDEFVKINIPQHPENYQNNNSSSSSSSRSSNAYMNNTKMDITTTKDSSSSIKSKTTGDNSMTGDNNTSQHSRTSSYFPTFFNPFHNYFVGGGGSSSNSNNNSSSKSNNNTPPVVVSTKAAEYHNMEGSNSIGGSSSAMKNGSGVVVSGEQIMYEQQQQQQRQQQQRQQQQRQQQQLSSSPSSSTTTTKKPKLTEFLVDHLFNVKAELDLDMNSVKGQLERVLTHSGIDYYFSSELNAFMCRERNGNQNTFTIDLTYTSSKVKTNLFFKCGYGNVFNLRKLYTKLLNDLTQQNQQN